MRESNLIDRFWSKVDIQSENDCWNWIAGVDTPGYGGFKYNGKKISSHVMAWILTNGEVPNKLWVLHICDNRLCCNPRHLFLGTQLDNNRDMFKKGRAVNALKLNPELSSCGESCYLAKLTNHQVFEIRNLLDKGISGAEIGRMYGVHKSTISDIKRRKSWKYINQ
jgi:hypothetical protein